jgi:Lecithin retinol acyltransferase
MIRSQASPVPAGQLDPGTELIVERRCYRHHGIYVGAGNVIHYAGWIRYPRGLVEEISIEDFAGTSPVRIGRTPARPDHGADIVGRARSRLGERCYNLLRNNCEHFCNWCQVGHSSSSQVERFWRRVGWIARAVSGLSPAGRSYGQRVGRNIVQIFPNSAGFGQERRQSRVETLQDHIPT